MFIGRRPWPTSRMQNILVSSSQENDLETTLGTYIRTCRRLSSDTKPIAYRALVCPTWEFAANCSACRTQLSALLVTLTDAHRFAIFAWRSKFRACMITYLNYAGDM
jgi:hypothetical protein